MTETAEFWDVCIKIKQSLLTTKPDASKLLDILLEYNQDEREKLAYVYKDMNGEDLFERFEKECGIGMNQHLLKSVCKSDVYKFLAYEMKHVYDNHRLIYTPNLDAYVDILCTSTSKEISIVQKEWNKIVKERSFERGITQTLSGTEHKISFQDLLVGVLFSRNTDDVDDKEAIRAAEKLNEAIAGKLPTKDRVFVRIFTENSYEQLKNIFNEYKNISSRKWSIEDAIKYETKGQFRSALLAIAQVAKDRLSYFVKRFYDSAEGEKLTNFYLVWTRIIIMNLKSIGLFKQKFEETYGQGLEQYINEHCVGDGDESTFKTYLVRLINQELKPKVLANNSN